MNPSSRQPAFAPPLRVRTGARPLVVRRCLRDAAGLAVWAVWAVLVLCASSGLRPAQATPAQGYSFSLTPLWHQADQWLLLRGDELSDPNTSSSSGALLPSMKLQRQWWLVFDAKGRARCSLAVGTLQASTTNAAPNAPQNAPQNATPNAASTTTPGTAPLPSAWAQRLRAGCPALRSLPALRAGAAGPGAWTAVPAGAVVAATWSTQKVCVGSRCAPTTLGQRSLFDKSALAPEKGAVASASARCVANHWLLVTNTEDPAGDLQGLRFVGLPPALRDDIVGHEVVQVDGVALVPAAWRCGP
jgi:hypothetical protein